ncbi:hypothetical protein M0812_08583 [Anaeramoeba flamelloides]|uniref:RING-type domain-containing protein n=1 Tax=Anaeramoeba flamelloides TaxID=1746091 RepID=A0AAV7ZVM4_9EUKA|nr:hypothetical protein M0812_08583 [Anaeramoeba flamelloides]
MTFFLSEIECPICLDTLKTPIKMCKNGHSFCQVCIEIALHTSKQCPICRIETTKNSLSRNLFLENFIKKWKEIQKHHNNDGVYQELENLTKTNNTKEKPRIAMVDFEQLGNLHLDMKQQIEQLNTAATQLDKERDLWKTKTQEEQDKNENLENKVGQLEEALQILENDLNAYKNF